MSHQEKAEIRQGTLALMILKTLESMAPLHGYGIAKRIEQTSGDILAVPYGTIYPALIKLEQESFVVSRWDVSENNRKAKYYELTRAGRKHIHDEARLWDQTVNIMARFFNSEKETA
jgi:PadR family transcriptional regulator PadR